jgi:peptidoglycan/xylan/chitin deacetylase (PgdA/CDA1 family)
MYHKVGAPVRSKADRFLNVSAKGFERQMRLLHRWGYTAITFAEAAEGLFHGKPLPPRPVCITFDDGYLNVAENAAPLLADLGWPATVFAPTGCVGGENVWDRDTDRPILPIMGWERLRALQNTGWEIAAHTRNHPPLDEQDENAIREDIRNGILDIEQALGSVPKTFCYPFGRLNDRTPALVQECGLLAACTTRSGLARASHDPFLLPRVKIAYRDDVWGLFYRLWLRPRLSREA